MLRHFVGVTLVTLLSLLQLITALHAQIAPSQQAQPNSNAVLLEAGL